MKLYNLYSLVGVLRLFFLINLVVLSISGMYALLDFFLAFKVKEPSLAIKYTFFIVLTSFYVLSPISLALSVLLFLRRIVLRGLDVVAQSIGLSPLRVALMPVVLSLLLSFSNLVLSNDFFPWLMKNVWLIEKNYKKKQETGTLITDFWFVKRDKDSKVYVYVGSLDIRSGTFADLFLIKSGVGTEIQKVISCDMGVWRGNLVEAFYGTEYDFVKGRFRENISGDTIEVGINLKDISLFAERVEHVSFLALVHLYTVGSKVGFDVSPYLGEILYRIGMSLFPLFLVVPVSYSMLRYRSLKVSSLYFLVNASLVWFIVSLLDILPSKAGVSPLPVLFLYGIYLVYILKGIYNLNKGFRL